MNIKTLSLAIAFAGLSLSASAQKTFTYQGNPLVRDNFTADPAPMVWGDRLYVYVGHDEWYDGQDKASGGKEFNITEWLCYSTSDMKTWTDHGSVLRPGHFAWGDTITAGVGTAWASQVVPRNGKFYYYTTLQGKGENSGYAVGVAVADSPTGPFKPTDKPLVNDKMTDNGKRGWWNDIDPTVLIDDDGQAYLCWGNGTCFMAKLKSNMTELDGDIWTVPLPRYTEGPWLHKKDGIYYLTYASSGFDHKEAIDYAMSKSIMGPWEHKGQVTGGAENSFTIHPGIIQFKGEWYLFYHNATLTLDGHKGAIGRRSVCFDKLYYNADGTMQFVKQTKPADNAQQQQRPQAQQGFGFGGQQVKNNNIPCSEKFTDINYAGDDKAYHTMDIYLPETKAEKYPVVVHIYGSAWFSNNSKGHADLGTIGAALLKAGYAVVCPNHRSSGDAKWPAQCHDIKAVVRYLRANAAKYHLDADFIATSGFSSGGHLSSVMAATSGTKKAKVGKEKIDLEGSLGSYTKFSSKINAAVDWSGPIDLEDMDCAGKRNMKNTPEEALLGCALTPENHDRYASLNPITFLDRKDPPVIIFHGTNDQVVPFCQGEKFALAVEGKGIKTEFNPVQGGGHGFGGMYSEENLKRMVNFLDNARKK